MLQSRTKFFYRVPGSILQLSRTNKNWNRLPGSRPNRVPENEKSVPRMQEPILKTRYPIPGTSFLRFSSMQAKNSPNSFRILSFSISRIKKKSLGSSFGIQVHDDS